MSVVTKSKLLSKGYKKIETEIIEFFMRISEMSDLNKSTTQIFAYLKIYKKLTQDQLKKLTNLAISTISTTLQSFIQTGIITRRYIPNTHTNLYELVEDRTSFIYLQFSALLENYIDFERDLISISNELEKFKNRHPKYQRFLQYRINSVRNYIEAQRRAIAGTKKYDFFDEETKDILKDKIIVYPPEIKKIEEKVVGIIVKRNYLLLEKPIHRTLIAYMLTRQRFTQEMLLKLSNYSRSTVSRILSDFVTNGLLEKVEREYRKPTIYSLKYFSVNLIDSILRQDSFIFNWQDKFNTILLNLKKEKSNSDNKDDKLILIDFLTRINGEINDLKKSSKLLSDAKSDLLARVNR